MLANLKAALAAKRLRQFELAAELKISPATMSEIILGRRPLEDGQRTRIAAVLGVEDVEWLFAVVRPRARRADPPTAPLAAAPASRG